MSDQEITQTLENPSPVDSGENEGSTVSAETSTDTVNENVTTDSDDEAADDDSVIDSDSTIVAVYTFVKGQKLPTVTFGRITGSAASPRVALSDDDGNLFDPPVSSLLRKCGNVVLGIARENKNSEKLAKIEAANAKKLARLQKLQAEQAKIRATMEKLQADLMAVAATPNDQIDAKLSDDDDDSTGESNA